MPLEIKELHIRVTVNQPQQGQPSGAQPVEGSKAEDEKDSLIAQCVDEVVDIINSKKER
jgi:hypothetical protein